MEAFQEALPLLWPCKRYGRFPFASSAVFFQDVPFRSPHHFISQYISKTSVATFQDILHPFFSFSRSVPPRFRHHQSIGSAPFLCYTGCVPAPGSIPVSPGGTMSALPFLHDRQFSPRLSLVCLVCLLLLPACPAPGSDLDGTAHNHHAQIRAGDAYSNVYGVMAYGDSARARYGTVVNDGGQAVQTFGGWCYGGVADTAYNSIVVNGGRISDNAYGGSALATMFARSNSNTVLQIGGDVSHIVGGNADSGRDKALADSNLVIIKGGTTGTVVGGHASGLLAARPVTTWSVSPAAPLPASPAAVPPRPTGQPTPVSTPFSSAAAASGITSSAASSMPAATDSTAHATMPSPSRAAISAAMSLAAPSRTAWGRTSPPCPLPAAATASTCWAGRARSGVWRLSSTSTLPCPTACGPERPC